MHAHTQSHNRDIMRHRAIRRDSQLISGLLPMSPHPPLCLSLPLGFLSLRHSRQSYCPHAANLSPLTPRLQPFFKTPSTTPCTPPYLLLAPAGATQQSSQSDLTTPGFSEQMTRRPLRCHCLAMCPSLVPKPCILPLSPGRTESLLQPEPDTSTPAGMVKKWTKCLTISMGRGRKMEANLCSGVVYCPHG